MPFENDNLINCSQFEELLTDYLDKSLDAPVHKAVAGHAMSCPLCHSLLNDVKGALAVCKEIAEPRQPLTRLEARILASTTPEASLSCDEFEDYLTDYLDGFLPAQVFHRWERHAILCSECSDLPGAVVRSLAACVAFKIDELPLPAGLHERIMQQTIGSERSTVVRIPRFRKFAEWASGLRFPISVPQLAPVAFMLLFAFLVFSQTVSADGSFADVYTKSVELAEQTYKQGADAIRGTESPQSQATDPVTGTNYVEDKK